MSYAKKLRNAATAAATEAVHRERARCLWLCQALIDQLVKEVDAKVLMEQEHRGAQLKLRIARALILQLKRGIVAGMRPQEPIKNLNIPVKDVDEMAKRIGDMTSLLMEVGFDGVKTPQDIRDQLKEWDEQEDKIMELEEKIEELQQ
jgi:hypothetical protein